MIFSEEDVERARRLADTVAGMTEDSFWLDDDDEESDPPEMRGYGEWRRAANDKSVRSFFDTYPHLLFPSGFDEFRFDKAPTVFELRKTKDARIEESDRRSPTLLRGDTLRFRAAASGAWHRFEGIVRSKRAPAFRFTRRDGSRRVRREVLTDKWLVQLEKAHRNPEPSMHSLWIPQMWTPQRQQAIATTLRQAIEPIATTLRSHSLSLDSLTWQELEELVAELLRERGLKVFHTKLSADGGRDIVARGELVRGEPLEFAVEVKHHSTVGLRDVQSALQANRDYPALMIATSGRFSAGVIREKRLAENRLRLFLKDGVALSQWLQAYGFRQGWSEVWR